jgi:hypothetical protein
VLAELPGEHGEGRREAEPEQSEGLALGHVDLQYRDPASGRLG